MKQINPEELSDDLSSLTPVANGQDEESLNDTICIIIANNESSCLQVYLEIFFCFSYGNIL